MKVKDLKKLIKSFDDDSEISVSVVVCGCGELFDVTNIFENEISVVIETMQQLRVTVD